MSPSCRIAADVGNSAIKIAVAPDRHHVAAAVPFWRAAPQQPDFESQVATVVREITCRRPAYETWHWRFAVVQRTFAKQLSDWLRIHRPDDQIEVVTADMLPITVSVDKPECVGIDRLVAATAAAVLKPADQPAIIIDAGSAVTIDLLSADRCFLGGAILPGRRLQMDSLAGGTDLLPAIAARGEEQYEVPAKNTVDAIRLGIVASIAGAADRLIELYRLQVGTRPVVYLSGGDAQWLAPHLVQPATLVPDLVLRGILAID